MDVKRHVREEQRLNQALNGNLENVCESIKGNLRDNNLDATPEIAFDTFCYVLEELHIEKLNLSKFLP